MSAFKCTLCKDTGWVCENHLDTPWEGEHACGCGGAGCNCACNPDGNTNDVFDAVYASTDPDSVKRWVQ